MIQIGVTGHRGFIGRAVENAIANAQAALIPAHISYPETSFVPELEFSEPVSCLLHLAAKTGRQASGSSPADFYVLNMSLTVAALEHCRKTGAHLVFPSTYVYGYAREPGKVVSEMAESSANNPYTQSKIVEETIIKAYARDFGVNAWILRIFNVYGPGQNNNYIVPELIEKVRSGVCKIRSGSTSRDFVYSSDVADAILLASVTPPLGCEVVNIGSGQVFTLMEVAETIDAATSSGAELLDERVKSSNDYPVYAADISRARNLLGWGPKISFRDGIAQTCKPYLLG
ncbi:MAG: NAD(P)-dependent oxidoreductase [Pseudomonadota bacterium]